MRLLSLLALALLPPMPAGAPLSEPLGASNFGVVRESPEVWVLLLTASAGETHGAWNEFAASLGRCTTAAVSASAADGAALAKQLGVTDFPAVLVVKAAEGEEAAPVSLTAGAMPTVKALRKGLKKALKGCRKNSAGKFLKIGAVLAGAGACAAANNDLLFVIRSQDVPHEAKLAAALEKSLLQRGVDKGSIVRLDRIVRDWVDIETSGPPFHVDFWVIKPWLPHLLKLPNAKAAKWVVFLEPVTEIADLPLLEKLLGGLDHTAKHFLGKAIADKKGSIVHAWSTNEPYLFAKPGFALSRALADAAVADIAANKLPVDTHIEVFFEFSQWMAALGAKVADTAAFCGRMADAAVPGACATAITEGGVEPHRATHDLLAKDVVIGVKTTKMFHKDRLDVIARTWAKHSPIEIVFLSDAAEDSPVPTIDLTKEWGAVVNQKKGHCAKTDAIFKHFEKHFADRTWFVIADDDTWFHVPRLLQVLASYDGASDPIYLGERYGYAHNGQGMGPYDYITMGGGMAMSRPALLQRNGNADCSCIAPDTYDDMQVGKWFTSRLGIKAVHEEGFHQANPDHYHPMRLAHEELLSFHKFAMLPPPNDKKVDVDATVARYAAELLVNPSIRELGLNKFKHQV